MPKRRTLQIQRDRVHCSAGPHHREAIRERWRADRSAFFHHRERMLFRVRVTPYYGCTKLGVCGWWAIPAYIVSCESGGDWTPDAGLTYGGAYGIIVPTWHDYGGGAFASQANYAEPDEQSRIAHRIWTDVGPSAWACA